MSTNSIPQKPMPGTPAPTPLPVEVIEYILCVGRVLSLQQRFYRQGEKHLLARCMQVEGCLRRLHADIITRYPELKTIVEATVEVENLFAEAGL